MAYSWAIQSRCRHASSARNLYPGGGVGRHRAALAGHDPCPGLKGSTRRCAPCSCAAVDTNHGTGAEPWPLPEIDGVLAALDTKRVCPVAIGRGRLDGG